MTQAWRRRFGNMMPDFRAGGAEHVAISLSPGFDAAAYRSEFIVVQTLGDYLSKVIMGQGTCP